MKDILKGYQRKNDNTFLRNCDKLKNIYVQFNIIRLLQKIIIHIVVTNSTN
jgi:hypothetical protein